MALYKKISILAAGLLVAMGLAAPASAGSVVFNLGDIVVDDDSATGDIALAIPAGFYDTVSFTTDWSAISGDPWSNEAIWAITDGPVTDPGTTFYADPGAAPNALASGDAVTLIWDSIALDIPINGPLDGFLLTLQTFGGSSALWANSVLTLSGPTQASEPGILLLFGLGLIGVVVARRRS